MSNIKKNITDRIDGLNLLIGKTNTIIATEERCVPTTALIAVAVPILLYITLYLIAPKIGLFLAADSTPKQPVRNKKRILVVTTITTLGFLGFLIWYYKYRGSSDVCLVK